MSRSTLAAVALATVAPLVLTAVPATGVDAHAERRAAAYKVSAKISATEIVAGEEKIRITGRVTPKAAGEKVVLQQRFEEQKRWRKSGTAKIRRTGRYVVKDKPSTGGVRYYRVLKPASDGLKAGKSKEMRLEVWAWEKLAYRTMGAHFGVLQNSVQVATEWYHASLVSQWPGAGYVEYTLGDKCRSLRATYALTDTSASGSTGTIAVSTDGAVRNVHGLAVGTVVRDNVIDVTDTFRLRFDLRTSATPGTPAGYATVADPEVLCLG